jgi:molybdopterin-guanine dinucleotide biosynthesis protein B
MMTAPKTVSVVGFKDSGKTRVVEAIVGELTARGLRVGTLKHTVESMELDTPGKDTSRHRVAGAKASAILHDKAAAVFIDEYLTVMEAANHLGSLDVLVIEGFKTLSTHARILVPRYNEDVKSLSNGLEIAAVKLPSSSISNDIGLPIYSLDDSSELVDLIMKKAYPMLPGANCNGCGYDDCLGLGKAILKGEASAKSCVLNRSGFTLKVNDNPIPLNNFVRKALTRMLLGFVSTLQGGEKAAKVDLSFEVEEDE